MGGASYAAMSVLTVTNVPDEVLAELERLATAHGVSVEDEVRRVLTAAVPMTKAPAMNEGEAKSFKEHLLNFPAIADEDLWMFDRHDPRNARPKRKPVDFSD